MGASSCRRRRFSNENSLITSIDFMTFCTGKSEFSGLRSLTDWCHLQRGYIPISSCHQAKNNQRFNYSSFQRDECFHQMHVGMGCIQVICSVSDPTLKLVSALDVLFQKSLLSDYLSLYSFIQMPINMCIYIYLYVYIHIQVWEKGTENSICALVHHLYFSPPQKYKLSKGQITLGSLPRSAATMHRHTSVLQEQINMTSSEKSSALLFKARVLLITCSHLVYNSKISRQPSEKDLLMLAH